MRDNAESCEESPHIIWTSKTDLESAMQSVSSRSRTSFPPRDIDIRIYSDSESEEDFPDRVRQSERSSPSSERKTQQSCDLHNDPHNPLDINFEDGEVKRQRSCRGKRERYRKLVERLKAEVEKMPFMDFSELPLPPGVQNDSKLQTKLYEQLTAHRTAVLSQLTVGC
jgi:hypothetical protein